MTFWKSIVQCKNLINKFLQLFGECLQQLLTHHFCNTVNSTNTVTNKSMNHQDYQLKIISFH